MNPISLNQDSTYRISFSDSTSNMLKYRFKHLVKLDIQATYKKFSLGISLRYNSFMKNIDLVFEEDLDPAINSEVYILPGLKEYREKYNKGSLVIDFRLGYKFNEKIRLGLIANNLFNAEYSSRPGDIQPPRNFLMQLQMKF
jgi:iron complex outermembrane receptor protein